ncbi:hypothetical protein FSP39_010461 [Pinctada imbricata]|uniref:C1q domain-containing protein n=1 Tax=Pinctada imbricata TaxID=66713 RepID=A0AA88Y4L7_PINIB|nr:hypothetical protein FSP39_010461 [Pinctada imbricata]
MRASYFRIAIAIFVLKITGKVYCDTSSDDVNIKTPVESSIFDLHNLISQESALRLTLDKQIQDMRGLLYQLKSEQETIITKVDMLNNKCANVSENLKQKYLADSKMNVSHQDLKSLVNQLKSEQEEILPKFDTMLKNMYDNVTENLRQNCLTEQNADTKINESYRVLSYLVEEKLTQIGKEIASNISRKQDDVVAFTAVLSLSKTFGRDELIVYDRIITNVGGAYSSASGLFTSPEEGTHVFTWTHLTYNEHYCHAFLYKNANKVSLDAHSNLQGISRSLYTMATMSGTLQLTKGDQVSIRAAIGCTFFYSSPYNSFSGWKL